jgi:hypothetical protein
VIGVIAILSCGFREALVACTVFLDVLRGSPGFDDASLRMLREWRTL